MVMPVDMNKAVEIKPDPKAPAHEKKPLEDRTIEVADYVRPAIDKLKNIQKIANDSSKARPDDNAARTKTGEIASNIGHLENIAKSTTNVLEKLDANKQQTPKGP